MYDWSVGWSLPGAPCMEYADGQDWGGKPGTERVTSLGGVFHCASAMFYDFGTSAGYYVSIFRFFGVIEIRNETLIDMAA